VLHAKRRECEEMGDETRRYKERVSAYWEVLSRGGSGEACAVGVAKGGKPML